jgi:DNA-binding NarL/FixJ family response regulator
MWRGQEDVWLTPDEMARRASGRKHVNAVRQCRATLRRLAVARLLLQGYARGTIAAKLGVHASTISRDLQRLMREGQSVRCPTCQRGYNGPDLSEG